MSSNGKTCDITRSDLLVVAKEMNIKKAEVIIDEVLSGVTHWKKFAKNAEVHTKQIAAIGELHLVIICEPIS